MDTFLIEFFVLGSFITGIEFLNMGIDCLTSTKPFQSKYASIRAPEVLPAVVR